jgi:hypothetical protein
VIPVDHDDIQRSAIKLIEKDTGRKVRMHALMVFENFPNQEKRFLNFSRRGIISNRYVSTSTNGRTATDILYVGARHLFIGNGDKMTGQSPHP